MDRPVTVAMREVHDGCLMGGADERPPLLPPGPSPPCCVERTAFGMLIATIAAGVGGPPDLPAGGHPFAAVIIIDADYLQGGGTVRPVTSGRLRATSSDVGGAGGFTQIIHYCASSPGPPPTAAEIR